MIAHLSSISSGSKANGKSLCHHFDDLDCAIGGNALSDETLKILEEIEKVKKFGTITSHQRFPISTPKNISLEEKLFDACAQAKVLASAVSMHLKSEIREKLFRQIDLLHDADEWDPKDEPINSMSFTTFLTALLILKPDRGPGLGLTHTGNVIAAWINGKDRLTIEFTPNTAVNWVITRYFDDDQEIVSGHSSVNRLLDNLKPYHTENWFSK